MDAKTKWLIAGFVYFIGTIGSFIVKFLSVRGYSGSDVRAFEEALIAGALWPVELVKLLFKIL